MATTIKKITAKRDADIETVIKEVLDKQPTTVIIFGLLQWFRRVANVRRSEPL
jgi:thiamine pyrophosphokinase